MELDVQAYERALDLARRQTRGGYVKRGTRNPRAVKALQKRLGELGFAVNEDGLFGEKTERALRSFQDSRGAKVDGVVGKETLGKLIRATKAEANGADTGIDAIAKVVTPQAKKAQGNTTNQSGLGEIRAEQRGGGREAGRRARRGEGSTTKPKGPNGGTVDAFGKERATKETGPIGSTEVKDPQNASFEEAHPRGGKGTAEGGKFVKKGDSGTPVANTQSALNEVGGSELTKDGKFGPKTDAAVRQFQQKAGLVADGIVGPLTSGALRRRLNRKPGRKTAQGRKARASTPGSAQAARR